MLLLTTAVYSPNGAISLTQTFNRILLYVCNGRYLGFKKQKQGIEEESCLSQPFKEHLTRVRHERDVAIVSALDLAVRLLGSSNDHVLLLL